MRFSSTPSGRQLLKNTAGSLRFHTFKNHFSSFKRQSFYSLNHLGLKIHLAQATQSGEPEAMLGMTHDVAASMGNHSRTQQNVMQFRHSQGEWPSCAPAYCARASGAGVHEPYLNTSLEVPHGRPHSGPLPGRSSGLDGEPPCLPGNLLLTMTLGFTKLSN